MKFLESSIKSALNFFKEAVSSEEIAMSKGLLQLFDSRLKVLLFLSLIVLTCFVRDILQLVMLYVISIILAVLSRIKVLFFIKRVWLFIPLFTLFIAIPAVFIHGLLAALIFIMRVTTCVSFAVLLTITTRHRELLKSFVSFGAPNMFIQTFDMTYRYIFFFVKVFEEMHMGLKSRLMKNFDIKNSRKWIGSRIGYLFKRSVKMSEDVYMSMIARGYTGEIKRYER